MKCHTNVCDYVPLIVSTSLRNLSPEGILPSPQDFDAAEKLADFPELGRKVPETDYQERIREVLFQNYRIIYLHQGGGVDILAVIHGSRDLANLPGKPWEVG
jgi:ParE toxin of type II toxin-antitoxin system, parDE